MKSKISLTINSSTTHGGALAVDDAMAQVLDFFKLMKDDYVSWKIVSATMNSPFHIDCEPFSDSISVKDVTEKAIIAKEKLESRLISFIEGDVPPAWASGEIFSCAKNLLKRSQNGIGRFDIDFNDDLPPLTIIPALATNALRKISIEKEDWSREELGSIEGTIIDIGLNYLKPAIQVKDRLTKDEIWCIIPSELIDYISNLTEAKDVWRGQRVIVDGLIRYNKKGSISRVVVSEITKVKKGGIMLDDIIDPRFTNGLSPVEYLNILRGE